MHGTIGTGAENIMPHSAIFISSVTFQLSKQSVIAHNSMISLTGFKIQEELNNTSW